MSEVKLNEEVKKQAHDLQKRIADLKKQTAQNGYDAMKENQDNLKKQLVDMQTEMDGLKKSSGRKGEFDVIPETAVGYDRLLKSNSTDDGVIEFQKRCDALTLMAAIKKVHPSQLPLYKSFKTNTNELAKAMNAATSTQGGDWVPTDFSQTLYRQVELESKVAGLFDTVTMTNDTQKLPIQTGTLTLYFQDEAQSDNPTKIKASTATVANNTLNAKKLALRAMLSTELQEDSIIDTVSFITERIARAIAAGWDNVLLNGDTAATHMDTDVTAADDVLKTFLGIRALAVDGSNEAAIAGANLAESDLRLARKAMGKYGVDPNKLAIITGPTGYLEMISQFSNFRTADKYGPAATIFSGELGKFDGIPVIVSDQYKEDLNASGVYDGTTTTKTSVSLINRESLVQGTRRGVTVKTAEDITTDQLVAVMTTRRALINLYAAASNAFAYHVYNVA